MGHSCFFPSRFVGAPDQVTVSWTSIADAAHLTIEIIEFDSLTGMLWIEVCPSYRYAHRDSGTRMSVRHCTLPHGSTNSSSCRSFAHLITWLADVCALLVHSLGQWSRQSSVNTVSALPSASFFIVILSCMPSPLSLDLSFTPISDPVIAAARD